MSAYIVPDNQVILIAALHWHTTRGNVDLDTIGDIAQRLLIENYNSVNERYANCDGYETIDKSLLTEKNIINLIEQCSPIQVLKYCQNYIYQSDNHEGWKTSKAREIVDSVISSYIAKLDGYDEAKWSGEWISAKI